MEEDPFRSLVYYRTASHPKYFVTICHSMNMEEEEANDNIKNKLFSKGSPVEVNPGGVFRASWYSATISRSSTNSNSDAKIYVRYQNQPISSANPDVLFKINPARPVAMSKPRSEWVQRAHIRPVPPLVTRDSFELGDEVDAYIDGGWCEGYIYENLGDNKYKVGLIGRRSAPVFDGDQLRLGLEWVEGNKWKHPSKSSRS